ncbi:MAG: hypothetical protein OJF51_004461 [Nitrospira sp.]|nr:MAG: hypothetical protein OJF51_004461 [Nitrospira sp.]
MTNDSIARKAKELLRYCQGEAEEITQVCLSKQEYIFRGC